MPRNPLALAENAPGPSASHVHEGRKGSEWLGKNVSHDEACHSTELLRKKHEETIEIAQYIFMYLLMFGITSIVQSLPCMVGT